MKAIIFITVILFFNSCVNNNTRLSNEDKINLVYKVLSDSSNGGINYRKCFLDTKYIAKASSFIYYDEIKDSIVKVNNEIDYYSLVLKENDKKFLNNQIEQNKSINIIDLNKTELKILSEELRNNDSICTIMLSNPLFNKNEDKFYLLIKENYQDYEYVFHKVGKEWKIYKKW